MEFLVVALGVITLILILKGVRIVPQAENWLIERFGKYAKTLEPGLNLINPLISRIARNPRDGRPAKIDIRECFIDLQSQTIITSDNANVAVDGLVYYKIMDPYKAWYGVSDFKAAIENLATTSLRAIMGKMVLDETLSKRDVINAELLVLLDEATDSWGTKITRVEIKDIAPPADIQKAMSEQMKAERSKRAQIITAEGSRQAAIEQAEGEKRAAILKAEGIMESAKLEAEARERLAKAEAVALEVVAEALKGKGDPITYLIGKEYVDKMSQMAQSSNAKFILLPPDILKSIEMLFGKKA